MEGRLDCRRNDVKQRRKTLRHSVLEERRQTGLMSSGNTPDENPERILRTRAANAKTEAARKLQERKARQAITAREVKKVRPPFNNYIRVKHTGLSPFRSYQDASKRSRVAPWRAPPPQKAQAPPAATSKSKAPGQQKKAETAGRIKQPPTTAQLSVPGSKVASGVMQFGMASHGHSKTAFKPPAKIQPIPFAGRSTRTQAPRVETENERLRTASKSSAAKKISPKARIAKKPVPKAPKKPLPVVSEPPLQLSKTSQIAAIKPRGMKKQIINGMVPNMEIKQLPKRASRLNVEPSSRVLRSSQNSLHDSKENVRPIVAVRGTSRRATKKAANPSDAQVSLAPPSSSPADDRIKGLEERSARLAKETERLRSLAEEWTSLKATLTLPTSVADEIDSVTGQTILLTTKKFVQYKGLIEGAYTNPRTTLEDLDGFWEMVCIQVRQLDDKYKALNAMKEKNWNTDSPKLFRNVQIREKKRSKPAKKPSIGQSNFRKFFAEKLKKEAARSDGTPSKPSTVDNIGDKFTRVVESPLLCMSVDEVFVTPTPLFNNSRSAAATTPRSTPRTIENALRASRSMRFSNTMMRLSSIFQEVPTS